MNTTKYNTNLTSSQLFKLVPVKTRKRLGKKVFDAILDFWYNEIERNSDIEFDINDIDNWIIYDNIKLLFDHCSRFYDFGVVPNNENEMETILTENGVWLFHFNNKIVTFKC